MNKYGFHLAWSDTDNGFIATSPEFPGLSAFGETADAALHEAQQALELFIKTYEEDGLPLPEPQELQQYSGQTRLRMPKSLHRQAAMLAASDEVSLNQFIVDAVRGQVTGRQFGADILKEVRQHLSQTQTVTASALTVMRPQVARRTERLHEISTDYALYATSSKPERDN